MNIALNVRSCRKLTGEFLIVCLFVCLFQITQMKIKHNPFAKAFLPGQDKDTTSTRYNEADRYNHTILQHASHTIQYYCIV